jgi:transposase
MTVPGVSYYSALLISSEIADVNRFSDHEHLCSYAGLVPGVRQSAERSHATQSKTRSALLNWIMVQCTRVHVRSCDSAITAFYNELAKRRGEKVAIVAAARKLMRTMYVMLREEKAFRLDG